ncbi:MAG: secretin N-terminal domain-containing protein [Planctomycetota bacterium]
MFSLAIAGLLVPATPAPTALLQDDASAVVVASAPDQGLFPDAVEDLALSWPEGSDGLSMYDVVLAYGAATGQRIAMLDVTIGELRNTKAPLDRSTSIPAADVQGTFEALLRAADCVLTLDRADGVRIAGVHSMRTPARNQIRLRARRVTSDRIELLRAHPAVLFTTVIDLPNTDVRQVSNSMRTMIVDSNVQQMLPAGNSNSMVIIGYGDFVADMVEHLRQVDSASEEAKVAITHEVIRLRFANAEATSRLVEAALRTSRELRTYPPGGHTPPQEARVSQVRVQASRRLNALLVTCRAEDLEEARSIVAQLDVE